MNLVVAAGLLLLATACKESSPVSPAHILSEGSPPVPELIIPLNDSVYVDKGKGKPIKEKPEVPGSLRHVDVMPKEVIDEK
ncbi:hypothetical protein [Spirosoma radiotolerans]|nr:hypothetical protein [Spirosoma radiotolerans]